MSNFLGRLSDVLVTFGLTSVAYFTCAVLFGASPDGVFISSEDAHAYADLVGIVSSFSFLGVLSIQFIILLYLLSKNPGRGSEVIAKWSIAALLALILISEFRDIFRTQSGMRQLRRALVWFVFAAMCSSTILQPSAAERELLVYLEHAIEHAIIYVSR